MTATIQNILVLAIIAACAFFVSFQTWRTLSGRRSHLGNCCSKGCASTPKPPTGERIVFLPSDSLRRKR